MLLHYLKKLKCSNLLHFVVFNKKRATFQLIVTFVIRSLTFIIFGAYNSKTFSY